MPNHDGTGPFGDGRPGRGLGPCGRTDRAQFNAMRRGMRRGMQLGFGGCRHRGWIQNADVLDSNSAYLFNKETLISEKSRWEKLLSWVTNRLADIEK